MRGFLTINFTHGIKFRKEKEKRRKMKLFAPPYYRKFKCIADRCGHSCCVGWEIDIDADTLARYESCDGTYAEKIKKSIEYHEVPHFRLLGERCPHLADNGLCSIICELSEEWLSDICREHPRFYNKTVRGMEVGLGLSCEEAARLILSTENYRDIAEIDTLDGENEPLQFDTVAERDRIYELLSDENIPYCDRLRLLWYKYGASPKLLSDKEWQDVLASLEYLYESDRELFSVYSSNEATPVGYEKALERFLAYLIYRHASSKETEEGFRASLGFAFFVERLFASLIKNEGAPNAERVIEIARIISEEIEYSEENTDNITFEFEIS